MPGLNDDVFFNKLKKECSVTTLMIFLGVILESGKKYTQTPTIPFLVSMAVIGMLYFRVQIFSCRDLSNCNIIGLL